MASFLDARAHQGKWLLRIDDLDTPRNKAGSADAVLTTLAAFGLHWDGGVYYQSQHLDDYESYLAKLQAKQVTYRCNCSRKSLAELSAEGSKLGIYPGICRNKTIPADESHAIRLKTQSTALEFQDGLQGLISRNLAVQDGDYILKRKDSIIAYQFAVVIDDYLQGINRVVRGCDLLVETPKQIYLQQLLGFSTPTYQHVPVIVDQQGYKLSKQTLATAVDTQVPNRALFNLLVMLKQKPPDDLLGATVDELLKWAVVNWRPGVLALCCAINP